MSFESRDYGIGILGTGKSIPSKYLSNSQIEISSGLAHGYIKEKTGIQGRYILADNESIIDLSTNAAREAILKSKIEVSDIKLIAGCTFSNSYIFPGLACKIHQTINAKMAECFDLMANCTAFQVGINVVSGRMFFDKTIQYGLIIGAAAVSRYINWSDPNSSIYFADGAGAAILGKVPKGFGILSTDTFSHTSTFDSVRLRGGGG